MNHKQKLGYTFLGAGIMAVGIIIGQFITPNIEAQNNGYFDKITCRELEVVDKDGKKAIVLQSDEKGSRGQVNRVVVYDSQNKGANVVGVELVVNDEMSEVRIEDKVHNITSVPGKPAILLSSNNSTMEGIVLFLTIGQECRRLCYTPLGERCGTMI